MILIVDNYDSFVFNVARYFERLGETTTVRRNDAITMDGVEEIAPRAIVLSPGPCTPAQAGCSLDLIRTYSGRVPILGICLGHQCIGAAFGARVGHAGTPMHGRASDVRHGGTGLFAGMPNPMRAGRYHSLIVEVDEDGPLEVTARSAEGEVMALAHREHPTFGVQFHPESVLTPQGDRLIAAFLELAT